MSPWFARIGLFAVGVSVALAAFGVVHRAVLPGPSLAVGIAAVAAVAFLRQGYRHLPAYVAGWLDLGVAIVSSVLSVVAHAASYGLPYMVLRGGELAALSGGATLLALTVSGLAYTHLRLAAEVAEAQQRIAELQRTALESRLSALSAQINPHFLFNTLNTLAEVVHEDEDAAEDLVTDLAAMMRTGLASASQRVPLATELDTVRRLLRIESARLGERLEWSIEGDSDPPVSVPGLLVQPLVENAVKYAAAARAEGGRVAVTVQTTEVVTVIVQDDGPGLPSEIADELEAGEIAIRGTEGSGGGLRNCLERLRLTWPTGARLRHDRAAPGTRLILELPVEER